MWFEKSGMTKILFNTEKILESINLPKACGPRSQA